MQSKYEKGVFLLEVSPEALKKSSVVDLHQAFNNWKLANPMSEVSLTPMQEEAKEKSSKDEKRPLSADKKEGKAEDKKEEMKDKTSKNPEHTASAKQLKHTSEPMQISGKYLFNEKISQIEDRIISAGMVGNPKELDLNDSFIDDPDESDEQIESGRDDVEKYVDYMLVGCKDITDKMVKTRPKAQSLIEKKVRPPIELKHIDNPALMGKIRDLAHNYDPESEEAEKFHRKKLIAIADLVFENFIEPQQVCENLALIMKVRIEKAKELLTKHYIISIDRKEKKVVRNLARKIANKIKALQSSALGDMNVFEIFKDDISQRLSEIRQLITKKTASNVQYKKRKIEGDILPEESLKKKLIPLVLLYSGLKENQELRAKLEAQCSTVLKAISTVSAPLRVQDQPKLLQESQPRPQAPQLLSSTLTASIHTLTQTNAPALASSQKPLGQESSHLTPPKSINIREILKEDFIVISDDDDLQKKKASNKKKTKDTSLESKKMASGNPPSKANYFKVEKGKDETNVFLSHLLEGKKKGELSKALPPKSNIPVPKTQNVYFQCVSTLPPGTFPDKYGKKFTEITYNPDDFVERKDTLKYPSEASSFSFAK